MERLGGMLDRIVRAMAGKKSPWGKPGGGGGGPEDGGGDGEDSPPTGGDKPRNPWLPGGGGGEIERAAVPADAGGEVADLSSPGIALVRRSLDALFASPFFCRLTKG